MNEADFATERELRLAAREGQLAAREGQPGATAVLADFYEEHGQPSRAALWRRPERDERTGGERDRTCIKAIAYPRPVDPRRDAMIWILCLAGLPFAAIGEVFKLSGSRVREVANRVDREVYFAARGERLKMDPATRRLRAAGAIPRFARSPRVVVVGVGVRLRILRTEVPPTTWPYTRPHEKRRRNAREEKRGDHDGNDRVSIR